MPSPLRRANVIQGDAPVAVSIVYAFRSVELSGQLAGQTRPAAAPSAAGTAVSCQRVNANATGKLTRTLYFQVSGGTVEASGPTTALSRS